MSSIPKPIKFTDYDQKKIHAKKYKTEVALAAIQEQKTTAELIKKYELTSQQINLWKREFLNNAVSIFASSTTNTRSEADEREAQLLQT